MALKFEWDEDKSKLNLKKHGVDFKEGKTIFNDPFPSQLMILTIRPLRRDMLISASRRRDGFWLYGTLNEMVI